MRGYAIVALYEPEFAENIGGAIRAAACYEAASVMVKGKVPASLPTDTHKARRHIPVYDAINIPLDCKRVAVELAEGAESLVDFSHPERAVYIFGPESGSLPEEVLSSADFIVQVPTNRCMNLAACVNVVLYDRKAKQLGRKSE